MHLPHSYNGLTKPPGNDGKAAGYTTQKIGMSLYNLVDDPGEKIDVAAKHPDVVRRLTALAEKARDELGDSLTKRTGRGERKPGRVQ